MIVAGIVVIALAYMIYSIIYDSEEIDPNDSSF